MFASALRCTRRLAGRRQLQRAGPDVRGGNAVRQCHGSLYDMALGNDGLDRGTVLHTLHRAIELDEPALLIASLSAALEEQGRAAAEADAAAILARGEQPLLIVLAASDGDAVSMLATTVAVPCPAEPSRMIH